MINLHRIIIQKILNSYIRKSSFITKFLFDIKVQNGNRIHWDFTTLTLKNCLVKNIKKNNKVLEIGTGPYAILSIFLKKNIECEILACDINKNYINEAIKTAYINKISLRIIYSDLFSNIHEKFDIIFFNSIYIARKIGHTLRIDKLHKRETDWCGGENGVETIERFLKEAHSCLYKNGSILLGFNTKYVNTDLITTLCERYGYSYQIAYKCLLNPSQVVILKRK